MYFNARFQRISLFLIVCSLFLSSSCGSPVVDEGEAKREKERTERAARCGEEKAALDLLDSKADEYAKLPKKLQIIAQPYLKGKIFVVESREKYFHAYDFTSTGCRFSKECRSDAGCSPTSVDKFQDVRARTIEEVQTVALISCRKVKRADYERMSGSKKDEKIPGYDIACELVLVDRTIPAVIHKKTFNSELLAFEEGSSLALNGGKELVARTPYDEMDSFLLALPRK